MRTAEERLELMHSRAHDLKRQREATRMKGLGGATGALALCLVTLLYVMGKGGHDITGSGYAGTSLLSEDAGGYVLVAVAAFAVGVAITAILIRYRREKGK